MVNGLIVPDIAIYGAPGAGKSTVVTFLQAEQGYVPVSFAGWHRGGLRDVVSRVYGQDAAGDRPILNKVGMGGRAIDEDFWVRPMLREAERQHGLGHPVANDDMRGENEWSQLGAAGFVRVHVTASEETRYKRLLANGKLEGSDAEFLYRLEDGFRYVPDYVVINDTDDKNDLFASITEIVNREIRRRA
jgi:hypothetical protein